VTAERSVPSRLRGAALIVASVGALGSVALMIRAGERTPRFLLVLFIAWVLAPFVVLLSANVVSMRWSAATSVTLFFITFVIALASLAIYGELIDVRPPGGANAFPYVVVPPASMLLIAIVVPVVEIIARRRSRRRAGA
jgi:hypothetical protein